MLIQGTTFAQTPAPFQEKTIVVRGDISISYVEKGKPEGIPVILLHGYSDSWHSYDLVLPELPDYLHAYALSMRGHGNSSKPAEGYSMENMAKDIAAFMQAKQIKSAVIVGHSLGSVVAQTFAINYPSLTKGLVLVGTFARPATHKDIAELGQLISNFSDPVDRAFVVEFQKSTLFRKVPDSFFETAVEESMKLTANVWKQIMTNLSTVDNVRGLQSMDTPTLLVWGDKDAFCKRQEQDLLLRRMKKASLLVYQGTGHAVHWEEPARFAGDLAFFINNLPPFK